MLPQLGEAAAAVADIVIDAFGDRLRFIEDLGAAVEHEGFWDTRADVAAVIPFVADAISSRCAQLRSAAPSSTRDAELAATVALGDWCNRGAVLRLLRPALSCLLRDFDARPEVIFCPDGTAMQLDGGSLRLRRVLAADMASIVVGAAYDPSAACPRFDAALVEWLPDYREREFVRRWAGSVFAGATDSATVLVIHGDGPRGKSVFASALAAALGEYARSAPLSMLIHGNSRDRHWPAERLSLRGRRLAVAQCSPRAVVIDDEFVAAACSREPWTAHLGASRSATFDPLHQVLVEFGRAPAVNVRDPALRQRVFTLRFKRKFFGEHDDRDLPKALEAEAAGILNWLVEGRRDFLRRGHAPPASVRLLERASA